MRPHCPPTAVSPASGVLRGLRAGLLAVLCVLLPLAGHVLAQCHAPRWIIVAAMAAVAVPGAVLLTRRRLTDTPVLTVLAVAQPACHAAYSLPGACAGVAVRAEPACPRWSSTTRSRARRRACCRPGIWSCCCWA